MTNKWSQRSKKVFFIRKPIIIKILYGMVLFVYGRVLYRALSRRVRFARLLLPAAVLPMLFVLSCATNFAAIQAEMPDISGKADGTYRGEYDLPKAPVDVTLDVRLENARITGIDIVRHFCSP
ncbi:MAG: hypothetical protein LBF77_02090, partial [Spirochaetaceae bacterium]|nr:hypothetical protein [Spirochaetaceae bacterium]